MFGFTKVYGCIQQGKKELFSTSICILGNYKREGIICQILEHAED